jgi:hypothetical protein
MRNVHQHSASAVFRILTTRDIEGFGQDFDILDQHVFKASFRKGPEVVWKPDGGDDHTFITEQLAAHALKKFHDQIERVALSR